MAHDTEKSTYVDGLMEQFGCTVEQIRGIASEPLYVLLHDFSYFNISTIDRFFQHVLRYFTREIGLQGRFEIEIDNDSFEKLDESNNIFNPISIEDLNEAQQDLKEKMRENALEKGVLDIARSNAEAVLSEILTAPDDAYTVEIEWRD